MPAQKLSIEAFLDLRKRIPVFDVRSPGEFSHAHIPGAISLPLFTDEERKVVGTAYKQQGRQKAIKIGLDYFGPKMRAMVEQVEDVLADRREEGLIVHCWRGGMRSGAVSWLLDLYGFRVYTLTGGYKSFRGWAHGVFARELDIQVVGGFTGSGKTSLLKALAGLGEHVIDLEEMACHRGSAFGGIGQSAQPTQEMFENTLGLALAREPYGNVSWEGKGVVSQTDEGVVSLGRENPVGEPPRRRESTGRVWLEDESQFIGQVSIPPVLWKRMRQSPVHFLRIPFDQRLDFIVETYGGLDREKLVAAIERIRKRLGGLETKNALEYLQMGDLRACFSILLRYYDKLYEKGLRKRDNWELLTNYIDCDQTDANRNADLVLESVGKLFYPEKR